jgi:cell division protein ZapE
VGRGKTFLNDLLFDQLGDLPRQRWHFHRFMVDVNERMQALPAGTADTVAVVADALADEMRLLVLDEFIVSDIATAMILGRLLERLFARGVVLVTTSNTEPKDLYRDGLQRARFLPAIALIERHCNVVHLDSAQDYRLRQLTRASTYLTPLGEASERGLAEHFQRLAADCPREDGPLAINGRMIPVRALAEGIAWFDFAVLCEGPRAVADYIEIARDFHTVLLSGVPVFDLAHDNAARRFVHLVDEFYDRNVNLLLSAAAEPMWLYGGEKLRQEFERTASRLVEMRTAEFMAREHRP